MIQFAAQKTSAPSLFNQQIRRMPKVDLHRHLDCCLRWSTLIELAPQVGIPLPAGLAAQQEAFLVLEPMRDLESVLNKFLNAQKLLASEEILTRLAYEACEDAYNDNILIVEFRYAPSFIAEGHPNLSYDKIHQALLKGIRMAEAKWPIAVGLICIMQRTKDFKFNQDVLEFAIDNKRSFVGLDIADNDVNLDERALTPLFQRARAQGLRITAHTAEAPTRGALEQVRMAIDNWGAERIGHGVQIIQDAATMNYVKQEGVVLEVCPISNYLTQAFPTYEEHPLRHLLSAGLKITLNSDDPGIFGTTLTDDYELAYRVHGVTPREFQHMNQVAAEASFIDREKRQKVWPSRLSR